MELIVDSEIKGEFRGWSSKATFELVNGQIWEQARYKYRYRYRYRPKAKIWKDGAKYYIEVECMSEKVEVKQIAGPRRRVALPSPQVPAPATIRTAPMTIKAAPVPFLVSTAFNKFRKSVDLDPEATRTARSSRDFLTGRITSLSQSDPSFPKVTGQYIPFGSFARKTKINPLDDIDLLVLLNGSGTNEDDYTWEPNRKKVIVVNTSAPLAVFADEDGSVNSIKILNRIKAEITKLHNYRTSEVKRNLQAVTLQLKTQPWNFDLVPALAVATTTNGTSTITHYLIPNGSGKWMPTDPRTNAAHTTQANVKHGGLLLSTVRLIKYWNNRSGKPRLGSFYMETLALKVFEYAPTITTTREALEYFFRTCPTYLYSSCPSPTGHGSALDASYDWETKQKVATAMNQAAQNAALALSAERLGETQTALVCWRRVFGPLFPTSASA